MKHKDVLSFLSSLFAGFWCHSELCTELSNIISKSGYETDFFNILLKRLKYLQLHGKKAINYPEWFEELKHSHDLYSMRLIGRGFNIRILYSFSIDGYPLLLLAFGEKSGKKNTDYTNFIPVAEERLRSKIGGTQ